MYQQKQRPFASVKKRRKFLPVELSEPWQVVDRYRKIKRIFYNCKRVQQKFYGKLSQLK